MPVSHPAAFICTNSFRDHVCLTLKGTCTQWYHNGITQLLKRSLSDISDLNDASEIQFTSDPYFLAVVTLLSFQRAFIPFHCDRPHDLQLHGCSPLQAGKPPRMDNVKQTGHTQTPGGQNKESQGAGKNKLYHVCCLGTLTGTNREATNYHYECMFLLQLQGELHTRGGRGSAINHIIFIVPLMLLAVLQETPTIPRSNCRENGSTPPTAHTEPSQPPVL